MSRLIIHAPNIHTGGGKSLLSALLRLSITGKPVIAILDSRMPLPEGLLENMEIHIAQPTIWHRLKAEWWLAQNVRPQDTVLCFGNLPPLFNLQGRVVVFVQNRYLVDDVSLAGFSVGVRLRLVIERLWLAIRMKSVNELIVQTPSMKRLLERKTRGSVKLSVVPFLDKQEWDSRNITNTNAQKNTKYDFLYVASGEKHKNHRCLVEAWSLLAEEGVFPSLCLTLDKARFEPLAREIEKVAKARGLKIENVGELSYPEVLLLYKNAGAVIYPSTLESFGLPLIEAQQAGLPVLAPEMDYVRDVIEPAQTFDPNSSISMARAVKRFLNKGEGPLTFPGAQEFLEHVVQGVR